MYVDNEISYCTQSKKTVLGMNLYYRFCYDVKTHKVELPFNHKHETIFNWVTDSIAHEFLHKFIHEFIGETETYKLDNLGYNIKTGCNHKENGDY